MWLTAIWAPIIIFTFIDERETAGTPYDSKIQRDNESHGQYIVQQDGVNGEELMLVFLERGREKDGQNEEHGQTPAHHYHPVRQTTRAVLGDAVRKANGQIPVDAEDDHDEYAQALTKVRQRERYAAEDEAKCPLVRKHDEKERGTEKPKMRI